MAPGTECRNLWTDIDRVALPGLVINSNLNFEKIAFDLIQQTPSLAPSSSFPQLVFCREALFEPRTRVRSFSKGCDSSRHDLTRCAAQEPQKDDRLKNLIRFRSTQEYENYSDSGPSKF